MRIDRFDSNEDDLAFEEQEPISEIESIVAGDTETIVTFDTRTGEVLEVAEAPDDTAALEDVLNWVGGRRAYALAKAHGLETERDELLEKIRKQFDPKINKLNRFADWTIMHYLSALKEYARRALTGNKSKTLKLGLLTLKFGSTRARVDILENQEAEALAYVKGLFLEAVAVKESIAKKTLRLMVAQAENYLDLAPEEREELKLSKEDAAILEARADREALVKNGINLYEGGEETFTVD